MAIKVTGCHRWAVSSGKSPTPLGLSSLLSQGCHEAAVSKEWTVLGLAGAGRPERPLRVVTEGHDVSVDEAGVCTGGGARREAQPGHSGAAARAGDSGRHFRCVLAETKAGLGKARLKRELGGGGRDERQGQGLLSSPGRGFDRPGAAQKAGGPGVAAPAGEKVGAAGRPVTEKRARSRPALGPDASNSCVPHASPLLTLPSPLLWPPLLRPWGA